MMTVYQEGVKVGLKPTAAEVKDFVDNKMSPDIYNQFKQLYSAKAVDQLVDYTIVGAKYEKWLRDKIRREQNITVTEQEANDYFLKNINQFHLPEGVYISIISVDNKTQADDVLKQMGSDVLYIRLCKAQACFRGRLTPKPWRCGHTNNTISWPRDDTQQEQFDAWLSGYTQRQADHATCRFLGALGSGRVHPEVEPIIKLHDETTRCDEPLPLA